MFARNFSPTERPLAWVITGLRKDPHVERCVESLLSRIRARHYSETIPVLASYWLKAVWAAGHDLHWWKRLDRVLARALDEQPLDLRSHQAVADVETWIRQLVLRTGQTGPSPRQSTEAVETTLDPAWLAPYIARLLNEWMPAEAARLLIAESEPFQTGDGLPVLTIGRAVENLLVRAHLSKSTLEMLLDPDLCSPRHVYPAHSEILRDVIQSLLGRIEPPPPLRPEATLLCLAPDSPLSGNYRAAVPQARLAAGSESEELHVSVDSDQAHRILSNPHVCLGSIVLTMDGRWWEAKSLQRGQDYSIIHAPMGRLRIDYSADHAKLTAPWPGSRRQWSGDVSFRNTFEIFGRKWQISRWQQSGERVWLDLVYSRALTTTEIAPAVRGIHRLRPASVDMAWSALETALGASLEQKSREPVEQLHHADLIPLGRAVLSLIEAATAHRAHNHEPVDSTLRAVAYFAAQLAPEYGPIPWRILPASVSTHLCRHCPEELPKVFVGVPGTAVTASKKSAQLAGTVLPSRAA